MKQLWVQSLCQIKLASALISLGLITTCLLDEARSQVVTDQTLTTESSVVTPVNLGNFTVERIDGGATRGTNLFHSFEAFSIPTNGVALFNNAANIQNIISRVTGSSSSYIDGIIAANGTANLFFINPNGIVFGPNAQMIIGGSFLASTASSINFADGTKFSATTPQTTPLLTVSVPIGLQFGKNPSPIHSQSAFLQVEPGKTLALIGGNVNVDNGFIDAPGGRIELIGIGDSSTVGMKFVEGNFSFDVPDNVAQADISLTDSFVSVADESNSVTDINASKLRALTESRLFGGLASDTRAIDLVATKLSTLEKIRNDLNALIDPTGSQKPIDGNENSIFSSGDINIQGNLITINGSFVNASSFTEADAGNIFVKAQTSLSLTDSLLTSNIGNRLVNSLANKGGNIQIEARNIFLNDQAQLQASLLAGEGKQPGIISVKAQESVSFSGGNTGILTGVTPGGIGNSSDIHITAKSVTLSNGAVLTASNLGQGNAGNILVQAQDNVALENSFILSNVGGNYKQSSANKVGNIQIAGRNVAFSDGSQIQAGILSGAGGKPGLVSVKAQESVSLTDPNTAILTGVESGAIGNGSEIQIQAGTVSLTHGAVLSASSAGNGNAGNILVQALKTSFHLSDEAMITTGNAGNGNAGNILVQAQDRVSLTDQSLITSNLGSPQFNTSVQSQNSSLPANSSIFTSLDPQAIANFRNPQSLDLGSLTNANLTTSISSSQRKVVHQGTVGNIKVAARAIDVSDGSQLQAGIFLGATGKPGIVTLKAQDSVNFSGSNSGIFTNIESGASGTGSEIQIHAGSVAFANGAGLIASNAGQGNAGNILIRAEDFVTLANRSVISNLIFPNVVGNGGMINIQAGSLSLGDRSLISTNNAGQGNAGNIQVRVTDKISLTNQSSISSNIGSSRLQVPAVGKVGNIQLTARELSVIEGSQLQAGIFSQATGQPGIISVQAQNSAIFTGTNSGIFTNVEPGAVGNGSNIQINARSVTLNNQAVLSSSNVGQGDAGNISVQAQDTISLQNRSFILSNIGNRDGAPAVGKVGNIELSARNVSLTGGSQLQAGLFTGATGKPGIVAIKAQEAVSFAGIGVFPNARGETSIGNSGIFTDVEANATGNSSDIQIAAQSILITDGAGLIARNAGNGNAGSVYLQADDTVAIAGFSISDNIVFNSKISSAVESTGTGNGGPVTITASSFNAHNGGQVITTTNSTGRAGDITLNIHDRISLSGRGPTAASGLFANTSQTSPGIGGNLTINTRQLQVRDGARVTVSSPQARAGNLTINAKTIHLNQGSLTAETAITNDTEGANIQLQGLDLLLMQNGSRISAQANGTANGGNISIDAAPGFVVTVPQQDNDIIASAADGRGGNIQITTQGLFGIAERPSIIGNRSNDIDASSQFGFAGSVTINTPDVDPSRGTISLPTEVADSSQQIDRSCSATEEDTDSWFIITGRGGLPPSPDQLLSSEMLWSDTRPTSTTARNQHPVTTATTTQPNHPQTTSILPAAGWVFNDRGEVTLVAQVPNTTLNSLGVNSISCQPR